MEKNKKQNQKIQFIVVREFSGEKPMREAFEQLIERPVNTSRNGWSIGKWHRKRRKAVESGTGAWYYNDIVSLFIEGEHYEQEKTSESENHGSLLPYLSGGWRR